MGRLPSRDWRFFRYGLRQPLTNVLVYATPSPDGGGDCHELIIRGMRSHWRVGIVRCRALNTMGAFTVLSLLQLAMQSTLDLKQSIRCDFETMWETTQDMNSKYKEQQKVG